MATMAKVVKCLQLRGYHNSSLMGNEVTAMFLSVSAVKVVMVNV